MDLYFGSGALIYLRLSVFIMHDMFYFLVHCLTFIVLVPGDQHEQYSPDLEREPSD
jgi:hypothetical protein